MRTKKLIAEMQKEIETLKERTDKLQEVANWLECHDRNDIDFDYVIHCFPYSIIRYFYNGEIKTAELGYTDVKQLPQLVRNSEQTIIVYDKCRDKYYQIDKATAAVTEIPKPKLVDDKERKSKVDILEERIEYLSKELHSLSNISAKTTRAVENQEELLENIKKRIESVDNVVEFINLYGADNLHIWLDEYRDMLVISYLYDNRKYQVDFDFYWVKYPVCIQNGDIAILECNGRYFQLDKAMQTIVMIPKPAFVTEKKSKTKNGEKDNKKTGA